LRERACVRTFNLQYFVSLFVDANVQTGATVAIVAVRAHPLPRFEIWPVALGLMAALLTDCPFAVTILQPGVRRRRIKDQLFRSLCARVPPPNVRVDRAGDYIQPSLIEQFEKEAIRAPVQRFVLCPVTSSKYISTSFEKVLPRQIEKRFDNFPVCHAAGFPRRKTREWRYLAGARDPRLVDHGRYVLNLHLDGGKASVHNTFDSSRLLKNSLRVREARNLECGDLSPLLVRCTKRPQMPRI
jgi:hypothetical protein